MDIMKQIETEQKLVKYAGDDAVVSAKTIWDSIKATGKEPEKVLSKIPLLGKTIGGFLRGELNAIIGPTGNGKTTAATSMTMSFLEQGERVLWFSFEMPWSQFLLKFHADYLPHFYGPMKLAHKNLTWLEERIIEAKLKWECSIVCVDHLHFLVNLARSRNVSIEIGEIVRNLKLLALKHNLVFFLLCHTVKIREDHEFGLGDARDSGLIEAESDNVLYIWRDKKTPNTSILKVAKNRKNGVVDVKIPLIFREGRLYEKAAGDK